MEDWSVAGSDSDDERKGEMRDETYLNFGGIKIPQSRLLQLMQVSQSTSG